MTKNNSNWKEIEEKYINNIVGCRINDLKSRGLRQVAKDTLAFFKPYFQEKMHEISLRELEEGEIYFVAAPWGRDGFYAERWQNFHEERLLLEKGLVFWTETQAKAASKKMLDALKTQSHSVDVNGTCNLGCC